MPPTLIEIVFSKCLHGPTFADLSVDGSLTIVEDVNLPESQQKYIHLNKQKVRALSKFLQRPDVQEVIKQPM